MVGFETHVNLLRATTMAVNPGKRCGLIQYASLVVKLWPITWRKLWSGLGLAEVEARDI
jgi:hypothetical protein